MLVDIVFLACALTLSTAQFNYEPGTFDGMVLNGRGGLGHLEKHRVNHDVSYYTPYHENPFGGAYSPYHYGFATYSSPYHPTFAAPVYSPYQFAAPAAAAAASKPAASAAIPAVQQPATASFYHPAALQPYGSYSPYGFAHPVVYGR